MGFLRVSSSSAGLWLAVTQIFDGGSRTLKQRIIVTILKPTLERIKNDDPEILVKMVMAVGWLNQWHGPGDRFRNEPRVR